MILAGDIGGTNSRLAICELRDGRFRVVVEARFPSRSYAGLADVVRAFLGGPAAGHAIGVACFGIAGPVKDGRVETTNLPWVIDARELAAAFSIPEVVLLNDLEAIAWGIGALGLEDLVTLNEGAPGARGNRAVVAAGTGLGEAGLFWDGELHHPWATEGGHASFAPADDLEVDFLRFLRRRTPEVSVEMALSGSGILALFEFFRDDRGMEVPAALAEEARASGAAAISKAAHERRAPIAEAVLDRFARIYGGEAGSFALKVMARGGVFIAGGIAPKILERLRAGGFMAAFTAKGPMRGLLEAMPVRVVLNDATGVLGAARCAALRAKLAGAA